MEDTHLYTSSPSTSRMGENDPLITSGHDADKKLKTKATPWHVIGPVFFLTFGMGALMALLVQFYTEIFCNSYYQSKTDVGVTTLSWLLGTDEPIDDSPLPDIKDCSIPEIQTIVSRVQAILMFLDAGSSLLMASYYGSLSDRYGRRLVFRIFAIGGMLTMLCYIAVTKVQGVLGVVLIVGAPLVRGFLAGDVIALAAVQSYITDCTTSQARTVAFGRMVASALAGVVFGPTVASILILETRSVIGTFYLVLVIHLCFYVYATFFMPESLDDQAMKLARWNASQQPKLNLWQKVNLFSALSIIFKAEPRHITRYAVPILACIQFLLSILTRPPILLYAMLEFHWTAFEGGLLISVVSLVRFIIIVVILPRLLRFLQNRWQLQSQSQHQQQQQQSTNEDDDEEEDESKIHHRILFDAWMIRTGLAVETVCFVFAALATTARGFTWALVLQSVSVLAQPSVRSLYTTLVDPSEIGALFGAQAVLESIANMLALAGINFIYSMSVGTIPSLFLYVCAGVSGLGFLLALLIHPLTHQNDRHRP